jgi:hypothetical protein
MPHFDMVALLTFRIALDEGWDAFHERDLVHWDVLENVVLIEPSSVDIVYDVASLCAEVQLVKVGDDCVIWNWSGLKGCKLQIGHDVSL